MKVGCGGVREEERGEGDETGRDKGEPRTEQNNQRRSEQWRP